MTLSSLRAKMNVKEVAGLLAYSIDQVKKFISTGLKLPKRAKKR
jgi:hypothetical protein